MRSYALTYPQLVRQATDAGWGNAELRELRAAHDLAHRLFDGLYRASGEPFICHTVRTGSIALTEHQPSAVVAAGIVHAAYDRQRFDHRTMAPIQPGPRSPIARQLGPDVERIVVAYHRTPWNDWGDTVENHLRELDTYSETVRQVLTLRVCNYLEDNLDLGMAHRLMPYKDRILDQGPGIVRLARALDLPVLAEELEEVHAEHLRVEIPASARWNYVRPYELGGRRRPVRLIVRRSRRSIRGVAGRTLRKVGLRRPPEPKPDAPTGPVVASDLPESDDERPRVLVTGAAGIVGQAVLPFLRDHYRLRLLDRRPVDTEGDDEALRADVGDLRAMQAACEDVDAVVHLAASASGTDTLEQLIPDNVRGTYQVFEAARLSGVPKVVFASTGQVVGGYGPDDWVTPESPVRPAGAYACTKVFGEALARDYADHYGMSMICLRLGWYEHEGGGRKRERADLDRIWSEPADMAQLIVRSIASDEPFAVVFAVSDNPGRNWDIDSARERLGYAPHDGSGDRGDADLGRAHAEHSTPDGP